MTTVARDADERLELPISGMTCASCAARIERRLNRIDGVRASVNYTTERASVSYALDAVTPEKLVDAIERAGYSASLPVAELDTAAGRTASGPADSVRDLRGRLILASAASVPLVALGMIGALHFDGWQWLALGLATPVLIWAGLPFHRAAWLNARHATATMDTLISIGATAAWSWSAGSLLFGDAEDVYFEVVGVVITFLLAGRWFEARAKRSAGAALRALLALGARACRSSTPTASSTALRSSS